jgi:hypothetical protein
MTRNFTFFFLLLGLWGVANAQMGPVFPDMTEEEVVEMSESLTEPLPLPQPHSQPLLQPKRNRLIERTSKQVTFDSVPDPVGSIIPQSLFDDETEKSEVQPPARKMKIAKPRKVIETDAELLPEIPETLPRARYEPSDVSAVDPAEGSVSGLYEGYDVGPVIMHSFGTGILDNLTLFGDMNTFKNQVTGQGNSGFSEGANWAGPITPQCTLSGQFGFRAAHSNIYDKQSHNQYFFTSGLYKRFAAVPLQGGVVVDWLEDETNAESLQLRQMRIELSTRTFTGLEYGFHGGLGIFDVEESKSLGEIEAQDYYLLFARKYLNFGGQVEGRIGATENGDIVVSGLGEYALNDKLSFNGSFTMLAPTAGGSARETWQMSFGLILYFRGGATSKITNRHRAMFDVAGNGSFFNRLIRR